MKPDVRHTGSNVPLNFSPRKNGSIHSDDWKALTQVGEMIRTDAKTEAIESL